MGQPHIRQGCKDGSCFGSLGEAKLALITTMLSALVHSRYAETAVSRRQIGPSGLMTDPRASASGKMKGQLLATGYELAGAGNLVIKGFPE